MSLQSLSQRARPLSRTAAALALSCSFLTLTPCSPVRAQAPAAAGTTKNVSLNLVNQPVQTALRLLFSSVGYNNSIDQAVQGNVTINVNDVSFDTALHTLLQANNPPLTYDLAGGVYHITVKQAAAPAAPVDQGPAPTSAPVEEGVHAYRIPIDHYDAYMIAELVAGVDVSSGSSGGQQGGFGGQQGGGRRGGGQQGGNSSVLMVPANDVLASGGSSSQQGGQQGGFGGGQQGGGFGGGGGGFGGGGGGFGGF